MEMHGPLMLLPPASVTLHSPCTLDESCWKEQEEGEELKQGTQRTIGLKFWFGCVWDKRAAFVQYYWGRNDGKGPLF